MFLLAIPALLLAFLLIPFTCSSPALFEAEAESPPPNTFTPENYNIPICVGPCGCDENGNPKASLPGGLCSDDNEENPVCDLLQVNLVNLSSTGYDTDSRTFRDMLFMNGNEGFSCIESWYATQVASFGRSTGIYHDDQIMSRFADLYGMSWSRSQVPYSGDRARRVNPPIVGPQGQVCNVLRWHHFNNYNKISCISGSVTLDKNCNAVQPDQTRICGNADLRFRESTPISLMWTPKASPEAQISIVTFPLNPGVSGKWYAWKASASTPLLVFDPDHTGVIDSAKQLFGEWTFGGKTTAALMTTTSDVSNAPIGSPWKHGFEALASLDVNGDNKISGEELAPLALWFDENQDGISQPGEVKRLDDVGVVSLYYEVSFKDEVTGALYATRGYDRVVDGKVETLAAVDWMSEEAVVPHGLSMKYFLRNELSETLASDASDVTTLPDASDSDLGEKVSPSPFFGMWRWSYDDPNIEAASRGLPQGYLIFSPTQDGQSIEGMSLVHSRFLVGEKKDTPKSVINFFPLEGKAKSGEEMSFEVKHNNSSVLSSAKLENNGKTLRGESTVNQMVGRNNQRVTYRWVAERL